MQGCYTIKLLIFSGSRSEISFFNMSAVLMSAVRMQLVEAKVGVVDVELPPEIRHLHSNMALSTEEGILKAYKKARERCVF